jgi:hypothetical protein
MKMNLTLIALLPAAVIIGGETGCQSNYGYATDGPPIKNASKNMPNEDASTEMMSLHPTINYIGETAILKFEPDKELTIPIKGNDLAQNHYAWTVTVDGVVPAIRGTDYDIITFGDDPGNPLVSLGEALVVLKPSYLASVQDGDTITVSAEIVDTSNFQLREFLQKIKDVSDLATNAINTLTNANSNTTVPAKDKGSATNNTVADASNASLSKVFRQLSLYREEFSTYATAEDFSPNSRKQISSLTNRFPQLDSTANTDMAREQFQLFQQNLENVRQSLVNEAVIQHRFRTLATGFRAFQMYTPKTYREKFLNTRLRLNEIKAFPMPDSQVDAILGHRIADHFYVVVFSAINDSDQERIVNTGLINAYGRAIVYPYGKNNVPPSYSIPIQVSPESMQQVYSDLATSKWNTSREWIFRSLDFGGALASAFATGFSGTPDLIKGLGLATSVVIPGGKNLWPDQIPSYLLNIVNFSMPELVKIPKNSSLGFKFLYFSKDQIHSMISDSSMFGPVNKLNQVKAPDVRVVYLSFDTLEVPFEVTLSSNATNAQSSSLTATINPPSIEKRLGQSATFTVNVAGVAPFQFQWSHDNQIITNATSASLSVTNLAISDAGFYSVKVTESIGDNVMSDSATLQVKP